MNIHAAKPASVPTGMTIEKLRAARRIIEESAYNPPPLAIFYEGQVYVLSKDPLPQALLEAIMPSKSPKQARTMRAAEHNPAFAKKMGIPQKVAREFVKADARKKKR